MKFKHKILLSMVLAVLLPTLAFFLSFQFSLKPTIESDRIATFQREIAVAQETIVREIDSVMDTVTMLSEESVMIDAVGKLESYTGNNAKDTSESDRSIEESRVYSVLKGAKTGSSLYSDVYMGDYKNGMAMYPYLELNNFYPTQRVWYTSAIQSNEPIITDVYYAEMQNMYLVTVAKAFKSRTGEQAVVAVDFQMSSLMDTLSDIELGQDSKFLILDGKNRIALDTSNPNVNYESFEESNQYNSFASRVMNSNDPVIELDGHSVIKIYDEKLDATFIGIISHEEIYGDIDEITYSQLSMSVAITLLFLVISLFIARSVVKPIVRINEKLKEISTGDGDLTAKLDESGSDEFSDLAREFNGFIENIRNLIMQIKDSSDKVKSDAQSGLENSETMSEINSEQLNSINSIVAAFTEMSQTSKSVAESCEIAATLTQEGNEAANDSSVYMQQVGTNAEAVVMELSKANSSIEELVSESHQISSIAEVISGITEQTNLLALNAAIEAARAGDHGRGFAVVADEVRALAIRTSESTTEIHNIVETLNAKSTESISLIAACVTQANESKDAVDSLTERLMTMVDKIQLINDQVLQIASATEQQYAVSEGIGHDATQLNDQADSAAKMSGSIRESSEQLEAVANELGDLVSQFKTE